MRRKKILDKGQADDGGTLKIEECQKQNATSNFGSEVKF